MAARDEKIRIDVYGPAEKPSQAPAVSPRFDEAVLRLARLLGRQIAREQFERNQVRKRKARKKSASGGT